VSLVGILSPVDNSTAISQFAFQHAQDHNDIDVALRNLGFVVTALPLDPMPNLHEADEWLVFHQQKHNSMNQALGLQGVDLTKFDLTTTENFQSFVGTNYSEHASVYDILNGAGITVGS
jgi:hypothetical protein